MKKEFSHSWISSRKPRKQRKYRHNAPLNLRHKMLSSHLSKELKKKYGIRNLQIRKGDLVKIVRGQYKKKTGKVERISITRYKVYVSGAEHVKKSGEKASYPIDPSNLIITELNLDDKQRSIKLKKNGTTPIKGLNTKKLADKKKGN
ncbi:MAG TPA: 50S ribosomal protein L24 [Candidatus Nanoarchaeia archaeon]|nr:50S ribosomal protein L24 [Candidatus Nanoarchaeia archaeon]